VPARASTVAAAPHSSWHPRLAAVRWQSHWRQARQSHRPLAKTQSRCPQTGRPVRSPQRPARSPPTRLAEAAGQSPAATVGQSPLPAAARTKAAAAARTAATDRRTLLVPPPPALGRTRGRPRCGPGPHRPPPTRCWQSRRRPDPVAPPPPACGQTPQAPTSTWRPGRARSRGHAFRRAPHTRPPRGGGSWPRRRSARAGATLCATTRGRTTKCPPPRPYHQRQCNR